MATARRSARHTKPAAESDSASGVIEKQARNQKAIKLEGDDIWYSVYKLPQMNGAKVGDTVSFDYEVKGDFHNIQGNVQIDEEAPVSRTSSGSTTTTKDRTITRLSLLKTAAELVVARGITEDGLDDAGDDVIDMAARLEEWVFEEDEE